VALTLAAGGTLAAASAQADFPYGGGPGFDPHDFKTFRLPAGSPAPNDLGGDDWKYAATPESGNEPVNHQPWELNGVRGASVFDTSPTVNTAWTVTTGRPDVTIAELDSGVEWNDPGLVNDLRYKIRLNRGELPVPNHSGPALIAGVNCASYQNAYDANGDGVFNLKDYACDSRINLSDTRRAGPPGVFTPEDITIAFSNGTDGDGNGYVDDIAGWDFLDNDNDPYDDVQYGHGSGEARGSAGEANSGAGKAGDCPNCMIVPFRVGDSFIADANRFAEATIYAVDNNMQIVQEALGTLNNTRFAREAVDYAYNHGVAVIASAADEAAQHHNYVSSLPHTIVVNSVDKYPSQGVSTPDGSPFQIGGDIPEENPKSYLTFNGCTNFSSKITVSIPSSSCSSNATEVAAGIAGLIYSAALDARDQGKLQPSSDCTLVNGQPCPISANEMRQLIATGGVGGVSQVDDVNFTTSSLASPTPEPSCSPTPSLGCTDPNGALQSNVNGVRPVTSPPDSRSYPARKGPDQFYGYGRVNAYRGALEASLGTIPPEVEIISPDWFAQVDPSKATAPLAGRVWARGQKYTCKVYAAPGSYPNNDPTPVGDMEQLAGSQIPAGGCDGTTQHTGPIDGTLASIDISHLKSRFPPDAMTSGFRGRESGDGAGQTSNGRPNSEPYGFTVHVEATTVPSGGGTAATGDDRRNFYLHRDQDMMDGFPKTLPGDGESSPAFADLNGDNKNELVFGTADGQVHAMRPDGSELPGWPAHTDALPVHIGHAFKSGELHAPVYGTMLASVAVGDLNHDGSQDVVGADFEGKVYAWNAKGHLLWRREANPNFSGKPLKPFVNVRQPNFDRTQHGFIGSPVLANLDGINGGPLDVVIAGMDRHLYAFGPDGSTVPGYPVLVVDHDKISTIDPTTHRIAFNSAKTGNSGDDLSKTPQGAIIDTPAVGNITGDARPEIVLGTNEEYRSGEGDEGDPNTAGNLSFSAIGASGLLSNGNTRLYAIKSTGDPAHDPYSTDWSVWTRPVKMAILNVNLLPVVGEGVTGAPVIGPANMTCSSGGKGPKVGAIPNNGFGYVLNANGSSCFGSDGSGHYNTLQTDSGSGNSDRPDFPAVGSPAFGDFAGGVSFLAPATGLLRAIDVVFPEYQMGSQDFIGAWDPSSSNGQFRTGFPARMNDLQFLTGPAVADIDGQSGEEVVEGSSYLDLQAYNGQGQPASAAWPKMTSGWIIANPLVGSWGTIDTGATARKAIVAMTRDGVIFAYKTPAPACSPSSWPKFHHDLANSGDYDRDATDPGAPMNVKFAGGTLTFTAPGDDLLCGKVSRYEAVQANFPLNGSTFNQGSPTPTDSIKVDSPGKPQTLQLGGRLQRYLAIRAVDDQGNVGPTSTVVTRGKEVPPPRTDACGDLTPPRTTIDPKSIKRTRSGFVVRGTTKDAGCKSLALAKRRNRILVSVSIFKHVGRQCRFLQLDRLFGHKQSCRRQTKLRAVGKYSLKTHTLTWRFFTKAKIPNGRYVVIARGVDQSGNVETKVTKQNRKSFRLKKRKKPKPRSSGPR